MTDKAKTEEPEAIPRGAVIPPSVIPAGLDLDSGDVMFTAGKNWKDRLVRWATRHRGEKKSQANHQQLIYAQNMILSFTMGDGPKYFSFQDYWDLMTERGEEWVVYRHRPEPPPDMRAVLRGEMQYAAQNWDYSHAELGLQLFDNLLEKIRGKRVILFRRLGKLWKSGVVCSTGSSMILKRVSWLPPFAEYFSPDDTIDYIKAHPKDWSEVVRSTGWGDK